MKNYNELPRRLLGPNEWKKVSLSSGSNKNEKSAFRFWFGKTPQPTLVTGSCINKRHEWHFECKLCKLVDIKIFKTVHHPVKKPFHAGSQIVRDKETD